MSELDQQFVVKILHVVYLFILILFTDKCVTDLYFRTFHDFNNM